MRLKMAPQCIICRSEILSPERTQKLLARRDQMTSVQKRNLEEEMAKGFMVSSTKCGHCFHQQCILSWVRAEWERNCIAAFEDMARESQVTGIIPTQVQVMEIVEAVEYSSRCPTCRVVTDLNHLHRVYLNDCTSEDGSVSGQEPSTSTPEPHQHCQLTQRSIQNARNAMWELTDELKASRENANFLSALLDSLGLMPSTLERSAPYRVDNDEADNGPNTSSSNGRGSADRPLPGSEADAAEVLAGRQMTDLTTLEMLCNEQVGVGLGETFANQEQDASGNRNMGAVSAREHSTVQQGEDVAFEPPVQRSEASGLDAPTRSRSMGTGSASGQPQAQENASSASEAITSGRNRCLAVSRGQAPLQIDVTSTGTLNISPGFAQRQEQRGSQNLVAESVFEQEPVQRSGVWAIDAPTGSRNIGPRTVRRESIQINGVGANEEQTGSRNIGRGTVRAQPSRPEPGVQPTGGSHGGGRGRLVQLPQHSTSPFERDIRRRMQCRSLEIGSLVTYVGSNKVPIVGQVRWVGQASGPDSLTCFGIEFAEPIGDSSGRIGSRVLFNCRPCHGFIATIGFLYGDERFRFDEAEYRVPSGLPVLKCDGDLKVGVKVVWLRVPEDIPEVGMVNWLGIRGHGRNGEGNYMAGVEFANMIGDADFNLCAHRSGHARLVHITELILFKDYFPFQDDLAALAPKTLLSI